MNKIIQFLSVFFLNQNSHLWIQSLNKRKFKNVSPIINEWIECTYVLLCYVILVNEISSSKSATRNSTSASKKPFSQHEIVATWIAIYYHSHIQSTVPRSIPSRCILRWDHSQKFHFFIDRLHSFDANIRNAHNRKNNHRLINYTE